MKISAQCIGDEVRQVGFRQSSSSCIDTPLTGCTAFIAWLWIRVLIRWNETFLNLPSLRRHAWTSVSNVTE